MTRALQTLAAGQANEQTLDLPAPAWINRKALSGFPFRRRPQSTQPQSLAVKLSASLQTPPPRTPIPRHRRGGQVRGCRGGGRAGRGVAGRGRRRPPPRAVARVDLLGVFLSAPASGGSFLAASSLPPSPGVLGVSPTGAGGAQRTELGMFSPGGIAVAWGRQIVSSAPGFSWRVVFL